jgi:hypothetical protein
MFTIINNDDDEERGAVMDIIAEDLTKAVTSASRLVRR